MSATPATATYGSGTGTFLRTGGWSVLLDVAPAHPLVGLCWDALDATSDLDDVLEVIVAQGLRAVPAFALGRETGLGRVVARGDLALVLDGTDVLADRHAGAWVDVPLVDVSRVEVWLASGAPVGPGLPLRDGAAAARGFRLVLDGPPPAAPTPGSAGHDEDVDERFAETRIVRAARAAPPTSEDTLPTTFTSGLAGAPEEPRTGRDLFVSRQQLMRGEDGIEAPRVLASVCPAGHLTPAYSGVCRVCRRVVEAREAFETARPVLGRLVLPQGDSVLLDRGAVLGRAPYVPADWAGAQPHLVALPDPDHDVSAQHVSVVLDLWNVLVCDLGSTNGTALVDPDGRVTALRPYEPAPLGPGSAIVVADVVRLQFEVHP